MEFNSLCLLNWAHYLWAEVGFVLEQRSRNLNLEAQPGFIYPFLKSIIILRGNKVLSPSINDALPIVLEESFQQSLHVIVLTNSALRNSSSNRQPHREQKINSR